MDSILVTKALVAFGPALMLLFVFDRLDVFNLINARNILAIFGVGAVLALLSFVANWRVMDGFPIGFSAYSRYVSPLIEEGLKAAPIIALYIANRIGFKLDAAIAGFAVGAGFATAENAWYLAALPDANVSAWMVRGFGTAVMHGGATALFAVISHEMTERQAEAKASAYTVQPLLFAPGLAAAIVVHSAFNHFPNQPIMVMAATLLLIPVTIFLALSRSERATQQWLKQDHAAHVALLEEMRSGRYAATPAGHALNALAAHAPADLACDIGVYAELKVEMVLRAEDLILASQSGAAAAMTDADKQNFTRLAALEHKLGRAVVAAVDARIGFSRNDLWELDRARERAAV